MVWILARLAALAPKAARPRRWHPVIAATLVLLICSMGLTSTAFAAGPISYNVQAGDTIFGLAEQFGVSPDDITNQNGLADPNVLAIGQLLRITIPEPVGPFGAMTPDRSDLAERTPINVVGAPAGSTRPAAGPATVPILLKLPTPRPVPTPPPAPARPPLIVAPYYSQFDGSVWGQSNCGPAALSMALGALGVTVDQMTLRHFADLQMGIANPSDGTTWEALVYAAKTHGVSNVGLYKGKSYRPWSVDSLKSELAKGHPVILLVRYASLPDHTDSAYRGDHYIVALGFDASGNLVYNDPAFKDSPGSDRLIDPAELQKAWSHTAIGYTRTAMALYR